MKYLVMGRHNAEIADKNNVREVIDSINTDVRIFRICGLNDPVELFRRWFGNGYLLVDRYGNNEGV